MRLLHSLIRPNRKYRNPAARSRAASKVRAELVSVLFFEGQNRTDTNCFPRGKRELTPIVFP
jgi:hypothetical protein